MKLDKLKAQLAEQIADKETLKQRIASEESRLIKATLEKQLEAVGKEITKLESEVKTEEILSTTFNKNWEEEAKKYPVLAQAVEDMKNFDTSVTFNTDFYRGTLKLAKKGKLTGAMLYGPTGTGKTTLVRKLGYDLGVPVISINASQGMKEEDIFGGIVMVDGKPKFVEGPMLVAMLTGCILVIEEINGAKQSVMLKVNSALDDLRQVYIKEAGRSYKCAPGFMFFGTFNPGYAGTRKMNKAFMNRIQIMEEIKEMTEAQLRNTIATKIEDVTDTEQQVAWLMFKGVLNQLKKKELDGAISVRQMISMIQYHRTFMDGYTGTKEPIRIWGQAVKFCVNGQVSGGDEDIEACVKLALKHMASAMDNKGNIKSGTLPAGETLNRLDQLKKDQEEADNGN